MKNILILFSSIITGIGLTFIVINLNVLAIGLNFWEYLIYIFTRIECILFFVGIIMLVLILKKEGLYARLRHQNKRERN